MAQALLGAQYVAALRPLFNGQEAIELGSAVDKLSRCAAVAKLRLDAAARAEEEAAAAEAPALPPARPGVSAAGLGGADGGAPAAPTGGAMGCSEFAAAFVNLNDAEQRQLAELLAAQGLPVTKCLRSGAGQPAAGTPGAGGGEGATQPAAALAVPS